MKTIRNNTFETNSSSCHVLTVADQNEYDLIKNGQAVIYVPIYYSQSEDVYDSVILTKEGFLSIIEKQVGEQYETYSAFFEESWSLMFVSCCYDEQLEELATDFKGVEKAYAIQAGREVRVIVKPEQIDDSQALFLAKDIAKKIEETMEYPGQIKVNVIRESRSVEYAK